MASDTQNLIIQLKAKGITLTKAQLEQLNTTVTKSKAGMMAMGAAIVGATAVMYALGKALSSVVKVGKEFEQSMANLKAISGATGMEMLKLEQTARKLGATTKFTASEVGGLQTEFAKLGFSVAEIEGATAATLDLAAATGAELAVAAEVAGQTVRGFGLQATDTAKVTDVMALSFSRSALDMTKFTDSMKYVAPVAKMAGFSMQETTAVLGVLANAGIDGSLAGTSLRTIFLELSNESSALQEALGGGVDTLEELVEGLETLSEEGITTEEMLGMVNKRAVSAFSILLDGTGTLEDLGEAFDNAGGSAQRMAEIQLDTLEGKLTILNSAWEGFAVALYDSLEEPLKNATEGLTNFLQSMTSIIDTPMSKSLEIQRVNMMALFKVTQDMSAAEEDRKKAMETLNIEYSGYLPNLITEKTSLEDIAEAQEKANQEFMNAIILRAQEEELISITEDYKDAIMDRYDATIALAQAETKANEARIKMNEEEGTSFKSLGEYQQWFTSQYIERTQKMYDEGKILADETPHLTDLFSAQEIELNKLSASFFSNSIHMGRANSEYSEYEKALERVTQAYNALLELYGKDTGPPTPGGDGGGDGDDDGGTSPIEEWHAIQEEFMRKEEEFAKKRSEWAQQRQGNFLQTAEALAFEAEAAMKVYSVDEEGNRRAHQFSREEVELIAEKMEAGMTYIEAIKVALEESGIEGVKIFTDEAHQADIEAMQENLEAVDEWVSGISNLMDQYATMRINSIKQVTNEQLKAFDKQEKAELAALKMTLQYQNATTEAKAQMEENLHNKYDELREAEKEKANARLKKEFHLQQQAKIATTIMSTATAVMKAYEEKPHRMGLPGSAFALAAGAIQLAVIRKQEAPTMEQGGLIGGNLHSQGGTMINAERGEFVMSRDAVDRIGEDTLDRMNTNLEGGESIVINVTGNVMSDEFVEDVLVEKIQEAVRRGGSIT